MVAEARNLLRTLRTLAEVRRARGDTGLIITPVLESQEQWEPIDGFASNVEQGLVLEPWESAPFETKDIRARQ